MKYKNPEQWYQYRLSLYTNKNRKRTIELQRIKMKVTGAS